MVISGVLDFLLKKKTKTLFFSKCRISKEVKFKLYGQEIERVSYFKFLGTWFDENSCLKYTFKNCR